MPIDYEVIHQASAYWKRKGYQYIDTPYWVSREAIDSTLPSFMGDDVNRFKVEGTEHHLVGSAEQSFYQMMLDGELEKGKYCSITPCFRDEPVLDRYHHQHFMKLELIEVEPDSPSFDQMVRDAMWFF
jgi:seryl-tRNA synthetase